MAARMKWPFFALAGGCLGAAGSLWYHIFAGPAPHYAVYVLVVVFSAWLGTLVGAVADWFLYRRSPLEPLVPAGFAWYRMGLWLRFAFAFAGGWVLSAGLAVLYIAVWGDAEELGAFFSPGGLLAIAVLTLIYALIGAVIGLLLSVAIYIFGGRDPSG